jgi:CSLREA domain-containing protein
MPQVAQAASFTFTVTKTADTNDGVCDADCSFREALAASRAALEAACPTVPCGSTSTVMVPTQAQAYQTTLGVLEVRPFIPGKTLIIGSGLGRTIVDGLNAHRDFDIGFGSVVNLSGMTIRNGRFGGADLAGSFCTVPHTHGGGLHNHGVLTLTNVTFTGNSASDGGAIAGGTCPGTYDSESDCPVGHGACATLINVTITGNRATGSPAATPPEGRGGGIFSGQALTLVNVTIANDTAADGTGIYAAAPPSSCGGPCPPRPMTLLNTIVVGKGPVAACGGVPPTSLGHNLVRDASCAPISSDLVGVNPRLGSLRRDGTLPLARRSPAVDHGNNTGCPATDGWAGQPECKWCSTLKRSLRAAPARS